MKKQIIIINGTGGSGKDSFVEFCQKYDKVMNISSVDKVKELAVFIGWPGTKTEKDRKLLSDLKSITTEYNDMSFTDVQASVAKFESSPDNFLFIHIREPHEIKRAVEAFNAKTLLIKRAGHKNIESNASDANVDKYDYDYIIENRTLEELETKAAEFIGELKDLNSRKLRK